MSNIHVATSENPNKVRFFKGGVIVNGRVIHYMFDTDIYNGNQWVEIQPLSYESEDEYWILNAVAKEALETNDVETLNRLVMGSSEFFVHSFEPCERISYESGEDYLNAFMEQQKAMVVKPENGREPFESIVSDEIELWQALLRIRNPFVKQPGVEKKSLPGV